MTAADMPHSSRSEASGAEAGSAPNASHRPMRDPDELIAAGVVRKGRGVAGEIKVGLLCNDAEHFMECLAAPDLFVWPPPAGADVVPTAREALPLDLNSLPPPSLSPTARPPVRRVTLEGLRLHGGCGLLRLREVRSREDADVLRGWMIGLREADLPPSRPEEEAYYRHDLEGLQAVLPDGEVLGRVIEIRESPAHDLLAIQRLGTEGARGVFLAPFVSQVVQRVELEAGRIVLTPPEGLMDVQALGGEGED